MPNHKKEPAKPFKKTAPKGLFGDASIIQNHTRLLAEIKENYSTSLPGRTEYVYVPSPKVFNAIINTPLSKGRLTVSAYLTMQECADIQKKYNIEFSPVKACFHTISA